MLHDICEAVDAIDDHRRQISEIAGDAVAQAPSPELLNLLRQALITTAKIMKSFHHAFDFPINPGSMTEDEDDLMTWAASYDKGFESAYGVLLRYS